MDNVGGKERNDSAPMPQPAQTLLTSAPPISCSATRLPPSWRRLAEQGFTQEKIAVGAGFGYLTRNAGPVLAKALNGTENLTTGQLHGLDQIIGALTLNRNSAGGLSSLALRLRAGQYGGAGEGSAAKPRKASWKPGSHRAGPGQFSRIRQPGEIGVLMQASALVSEFMAADKMDSPALSPPSVTTTVRR